MSIEEAIEILNELATFYDVKLENGDIAIETLLTAYEKEKRLAEANLKDSEEFKDNMCNHRCLLKSTVEELEQELEKEKEKSEFLDNELYNTNQEIQELQLNIAKEKEKNKNNSEWITNLSKENDKLHKLVSIQQEKNKKLSDKLTEKICKGVEEEILKEYRQVIIDKDKIIEELKKYKKKDKD